MVSIVHKDTNDILAMS